MTGGRAARAFAARSDALVLAAALAHGAATIACVAVAQAHLALPARLGVIGALAVGLCWGANTVSHIHLHTPIFRLSPANRALSLLLTVTLGIPQSVWKRRHLEHHGLPRDGAGRARRDAAVEAALLGATWIAAALLCPAGFLGAYLPAWLLGLGLCGLQGRYEHDGAAVDCHHRIYNRLWFNDGYHHAHHVAPTAHWTALPATKSGAPRVSAWPPLLRWIDGAARAWGALVADALDRLERLPIRSPTVRAFMLGSHQRALAALLDGVDPASIRRVCIVGGGLFPRSALVLRRLLPGAAMALIDAEAAHLQMAQRLLASPAPAAGGSPAPITFHAARYDPAAPPAPARACDLLVLPLAYRGDRGRLYAAPPAPLVIVHDWIWRRRGAAGRVVSPWLLKRVNLVRAPQRVPEPPAMSSARRSRAPLDAIRQPAAASAGRRCFDTLGQEDERPWPPPPHLIAQPHPPPRAAPRPRSIAPSSSAFAAAIGRRS